MSTPTEQRLYDDPKYRSYASQIEKALKNFEYSTEWADLISALVRLNKVLSANTSFEYLPKKITIGKRLSQCLHPALPGGVHIKALDVYDSIFKIIGKKRLAMDLHIYGAGIFSLLANASMQVRPVLLNVYETHLLPLGEKLRTSLDGVLLGLLPGLEEGSELFDRINHLLDKMSKSVGLQYFYSSLWRCMLSSPSGSIVRLSAMQLVLRQFDKQKMTDDQLHLIGLDVDVMVHAVCEALQDDNVLTQRATLDVLGYCFPLSSLPVSRSDAQQILSSALYVLLRRDMSLNRRLYGWILGTEASKSSKNMTGKKSTVQYFEKYSRSVLTSALLDMIEKHIDAICSCCCASSLHFVSGGEVKLIRVLISLLDKTDIGPVILDDLLLSLFQFIDDIFTKYKLIETSTSPCKKCVTVQGSKGSCLRGQSEFIKAVNLFINTFEIDYIWNVLAENFIVSCETARKEFSKPDKSSLTIHDICSVIRTLLEIVSMEAYVEIQTIHLPDLLNKIFIALDGFCDILFEKDIAICLNLSNEILKHIQPLQSSGEHNEIGVSLCVQSFQKFLVSFIMERIINEKSAIEEFLVDLQEKSEGLIIPTGYELMKRGSTFNRNREHVQFKTHGDHNEVILQAFRNSCKLLVDICCFPVFTTQQNHKHQGNEGITEVDNLPDWIMCLIACACCKNFENTTLLPISQEDLDFFLEIRMTACSTVLDLMAVTALYFDKNSQKDKSDAERRVISVVVPPPLLQSHLNWINGNTNFYEQICEILWFELGSSMSLCNTPARTWSCARLLFTLHRLCHDETVERILLQDILAIDQKSRVVAIQKFAKLWHFMRDTSDTYKSSKTFSRCLFAVLDQLIIDRYILFPDVASPPDSNGQAIVATTVATWLRSSLQNGNISDIIEPYILILLDGRTHRKSLQNVLGYRNDETEQDMVLSFIENHDKHISELVCENCAELQKNLTDETSVWSNSKYRKFSVDSVLSFALCEVHQQIAKERHRYEYLVGLLTLSDETETLEQTKSTCTDDDINIWATEFVKMVISEGIGAYQAAIENPGKFPDSVTKNGDEKIQDSVFGQTEDKYLSDDSSKATEAIELNTSFIHNGNPLYDHILIYQENFDANCVLYSLQGILNMASTHPQVFIYAACTTSLASSESTYSNLVQELLVRHERSVEQGKCFYEASSPSSKGAMRNRMLVEVLISICLNYLRSAFYEDIIGNEQNHEIQTIAAKLLRFIIKELTVLAQQDESSYRGTKLHSSTKQFSAYIVLMLQRHQVQSVALTCLLTAIYALKNQHKIPDDNHSTSSGSDTLEMESNLSDNLSYSGNDQLVAKYLGCEPLQIETMFSQFLSLVFELVNLEHFAFSTDRKLPLSKQKGEKTQNPNISLNKKHFRATKPKQKRSQRLLSHLLSASHQYDSDSPIASQKIFVSTILEIYRLETYPKLHQECSVGLHSVLPFLGVALSTTVVPILLQQCLNLENVSKQVSTSQVQWTIPPSYLESTVKSILTLMHYCLLTESSGKNSEKGSVDSSQNDTISLSSTKTGQSVNSGSIGSGLSTLLNVFNSSNSNKTVSVSNDGDRSDGLFTAKVAILNNLARIVSCMCVIWRDIVSTENTAILPSEESKAVSYNILQMLGPLVIQYGEYLLVAFSLVWQDRESEANDESKGSHALSSFLRQNKELENIIDFMLAIKLLSTEMFFSLVRQVIRNPPPTTNEGKGFTLQESILHMLLCYMKRLKPGVLIENWSGFHSILQDVLTIGTTQSNTNNSSVINSITTDCYFILMYALSEYVKRSTPFTQKKEQRELQDIVTKCIESCNAIAGSSLEQGTWIRRNVSVLPGPQVPEGANKSHRKTESQSSIDLTDLPPDSPPAEIPLQASSSDTMVTTLTRKPLLELSDPRPDSARERPNTLPALTKLHMNPLNFRNSLKALTVLSEVVANLLDVVYASDEKEKVIPTLLAIMANITPYLRNHGKDNAPSFCACIAFLASISGFQYTRKAWRKDVIDLLLDAPFFHMPQECVEGWKTLIDNLMTHDKTTFKEVMSRTSLSRPGTSTPTLSIFSNKEQELELRALHIKRLAFIVFSSETDQYLKQLPEIQERLAESLRLNNVPGVQCRVFLCFRVLLLRISPHSLTSLWPTMFTELVHAMLQLEQALEPTYQNNTNHKKSKAKSTKGNSPSSPDNQKTVMTCWLDMYLSACKLLDLALCLPVQYVPQFQLYKWSFIGEYSTQEEDVVDDYQNNRSANSNKKDASEDEVEEPEFVPHCVRIQKLLSNRYPERRHKTLSIAPGKPLINQTRLKSLDQLQMFFNTVTSPTYLLSTQNSHSVARPALKRSDSMDLSRNLPSVEKNLEKDFVRPMQ